MTITTTNRGYSKDKARTNLYVKKSLLKLRRMKEGTDLRANEERRERGMKRKERERERRTKK